jgi:hypothetical protein
MNAGLAFFLGVWAATSYERKGWKGFFKYFILPFLFLNFVGVVARIILNEYF